MRLREIISAGIAVLSLGSCASQEHDGRDICTLSAIGEETGSHSIKAELIIPKTFMRGAEISDGGISILHPGCDYTLNAFLSEHTAEAMIAEAAAFPEYRPTFSSATAGLLVWRFRDGSGEPRFFVTSYFDLKPLGASRMDNSISSEPE